MKNIAVIRFHALRLLSLTVLLLVAAAPAAAQEEADATVVTAEGWQLTPVTARWVDAESKLVVIRTDGARRAYAPEEIQAIYDWEGRNVSARIMPEWAVRRMARTRSTPPPATPPANQGWTQPVVNSPGQWPAPAPAHAAPRPIYWQRMLSLGAELNKPFGDGFLESDGGEAFDIRGRVLVGGSIYVVGGFSWQYLSALVLDPDVHGEGFDKGRLRSAWAGLALVSGSQNPGSARFYVEGGLGRFTADQMPVLSSADAYLGYKAGLGVMKPFGAHSALDLGLRATHVVNLDLGSDDDAHTLVGVHLALVIHN